MAKRILSPITSGLLTVFFATFAQAQTISLQSYATGFDLPVYIANAGDGTNRLFVVEQNGLIKVVQNGAVLATPFLDMSDRISTSGERGLLSIAFHPNYSTNGRFFIYYTDLLGHLQISEFAVSQADPNIADDSSERDILNVLHPVYPNHNGGQLQFGPDGFLYIGTGDGGGAGDPNENALNLKSLLGKILRIDINKTTAKKNYGIPKKNPFVGVKGVRKEIWAYGLRNPWRFSFDRLTGKIFAGDVGQNAHEEIDIIKKGKNYGWDTMEGLACYEPSSGCNKQGLKKPIATYDHSEGESVTGGYVYRGQLFPALAGIYFYADFGSGIFWSLTKEVGSPWVNTEILNSDIMPSSFGEDEAGEIYVADYGDGIIYRIAG